MTHSLVKTCEWPCSRPARDYSPYCEEHTETARRNVLRALGIGARSALMWREGDEEWLLKRLRGAR